MCTSLLKVGYLASARRESLSITRETNALPSVACQKTLAEIAQENVPIQMRFSRKMYFNFVNFQGVLGWAALCDLLLLLQDLIQDTHRDSSYTL